MSLRERRYQSGAAERLRQVVVAATLLPAQNQFQKEEGRERFAWLPHALRLCWMVTPFPPDVTLPPPPIDVPALPAFIICPC